MFISGSMTMTGSIGVTGGVTGSLLGTASYATISATSSYVILAQTASFVALAQTASYIVTAQTASYILTASYALKALSASYAPNIYVLPSNVVSASAQLSNGGGTAFSNSNNLTVGQVTASAISVTTLSVVTITSSIDYASGSNIFGTKSTDTQLFTGSVSITGSLTVNGAITATGNITAYFSDDRLKTKLGKIENALEKICSLDGFYYEANDLAQSLGYKAVREVGISAQSVQSVLPEIVAPAPIDSKYLTIHYERTVPLIIEAIKELRNEIAALKK